MRWANKMKIVITALLGIVGIMSLHAEEVDWKLASPVTIEDAVWYLDGGSVSVVLCGSDGKRRYAHRMTPEASPEDGGGMLSFRFEKEGEGEF
jgi:hypothetical protein